MFFVYSTNVYSNESIYFISNVNIVENKFSDDIQYRMNSPYFYESNKENISLGWGRWLSIAGADIIGAGTGVWAVKEIGLAAGTFTGGTGTAIVYTVAGVVCGAGASYATSQNVRRTTIPNFDSKIIGSPEKNIGQLHNLMLENCFFGNVSKSDFLNSYFDKRAVDYVLNDKSNVTIINNINRLSSNYAKDFDVDKLLLNYFNLRYMSSEMKEFFTSLFNELKITEDFNESLKIIKNYKNTLNNSKYDDFTRLCLESSLDVATSSITYWYEVLN